MGLGGGGEAFFFISLPPAQSFFLPRHAFSHMTESEKNRFLFATKFKVFLFFLGRGESAVSWYGGRGERLRKVMNHDFKTRGREEKCLARRHSLPFSLIKSAGKKEKSCEKLAEKLLCTFFFRYISDLASTKITLIPHIT